MLRERRLGESPVRPPTAAPQQPALQSPPFIRSGSLELVLSGTHQAPSAGRFGVPSQIWTCRNGGQLCWEAWERGRLLEVSRWAHCSSDLKHGERQEGDKGLLGPGTLSPLSCGELLR